MARPKSWKTVPGASRLSVILAHLRQAPRLDLQQNLRSIKLTLAYRNDHWGARRFMKEDLPRIRYANPNIEILVDKKPKGPNDELPSELVLEFDNGRTEKFGVDNMWSTDILTRVLDTAGGAFWPNWKAARLQQGLPVLDRPEPRATKAPTLSNPFKQRTKDAVRGVPLDDAAETVVDMSKTGAARILP